MFKQNFLKILALGMSASVFIVSIASEPTTNIEFFYSSYLLVFVYDF